jgi:hypothetical protein
VIVHPDPPLGDHEIAVLVERDPLLVVTTPTVLAAGSATLPDLTGRVIGISISSPPDNHLAARGLSRLHVDDAYVEFARWLLACGATLAYGGDLRRGGFTEVLFDLVRSRGDNSEKPVAPLQSYLAWPYHLDLTTKQEADWFGLVEFHRVEPAPETGLLAHAAPAQDGSHAALFARVRSLTHMRRKLTAATHARIVIGGQLLATGPYPGVAEETRLALDARQPTYVLGGLGGCANEIAALLGGGDSTALTHAFQCGDVSRAEYVVHHDTQVEQGERIDFGALRGSFHDAGWQGLGNGLGEDENRRLASTRDTPQMVALVLRGLRATLAGTQP